MSWFNTIWADLKKPLPTDPPETGSAGSFTPRAMQGLQNAREEAARLQHSFIGTEHLLLGLIRLKDGTAATVLKKSGMELDEVRQQIEEQVGRGPDEAMAGHKPYTPRVKRALALASKQAKALGHTYVGTEHILLGLLLEGGGVAARVLKNFGADANQLRNEILAELAPDGPQSLEQQNVVEEDVDGTAAEESVDLSKRYDIYCREENQEVVYKNASFKGVRTLFKENRLDVPGNFLEIEQADGRIIFVSRSSVVKFCEHRNDADRGGTEG